MSEDKAPDERSKPQSSPLAPRRGWIVIFAVFVCQCAVSVPYAMGVLYHMMLENFQESKRLTALVLSLSGGLSYGLGIFVAPLIDRFGPRAVILAGGMTTTLAFTVSFFATGVTYLIMSIGVMGGLGLCLINVASNVAIVHQFKNQNDLAFAISGLGGNVGGMVTIQLHSVLVDEYGVRGCLLITAALVFHVCAAGALVSSKRRSQIPVTSRDKCVPCWSKYVDLIKRPLFFAWLILCLVGSLTESSVFIILVDYVVSLGYGRSSGAFMITIIEISGIVGRLVYGMVSANVTRHKVTISIVAYFTCALVLISYAFLQNEASLYAVSCIFGLCEASMIVSANIVTAYLSDNTNRAEAYGLVATAAGVGLSASGPVTGWLGDLTGTYRWSFGWNGMLCLAACLPIVAVLTSKCARSRMRYSNTIGGGIDTSEGKSIHKIDKYTKTIEIENTF